MLPESTPLTLTWTPRVAELADAALARSQDLGGAIARAVLAVLLSLLAAVLLAYRQTAALGTVLVVLALVLVFARVTAPLLRRRWSALLAANPTLAETCEVTFDVSGVHLSSDRVTASRLWSAFTGWSDTAASVVLATSDSAQASLLVVPHRAAPDGGELARLRRLLETRLGPPLGAPGRPRGARLTWMARIVVVACLVIPLAAATTRVHDDGGEWRPWPSEAPPRVSREGVTYLREGGPTGRPIDAAGVDYTRGGGLVLLPWPPSSPGPAAELWVLDHMGVVRHYVAESGDAAVQ